MKAKEASAAGAEVLFERRGGAGIITLNRPRALNAVTHSMVRALTLALGEWARDPAISRVIIQAADDRAFSAGGDIRALYALGQSGRHSEALAFWREEYVLNTLIKRYPKPYIALIDGITMGGGVGLAIHGSHRIAGDRFLFAMPEVGIGFFPDVGATWFLPRMPGETGAYLALTGERLKAADGVAFGLATQYVRSTRFPELINALAETESVDNVMKRFSERLGLGAAGVHRAAIDRLFAHDRVEDILLALGKESLSGGPEAGWASASAAIIRSKSPTSLKIALSQVRRGKDMSFADCMRTEFRIVNRIIHGHDFYEGVRAVIIDKDNAPQWRPCELSEVTEAKVKAHLAPLDDSKQELVLP